MTITSESLADFGVRNITAYATEVNLDRAVPELYDGLKPVFRRVAWSAHAFNPKESVKSAKIVGHCIGSYSPHSDVGTYGAMVTMVNSNIPMIEGIGNWGSLLDPPAAMRYCFVGDTRVNTEYGLLSFNELARLSKIGELDSVPFSIRVDTKNDVQKTSHFVNSGFQDVVRVVTDFGYSTVCTPNEPFYVMTKDGYKWVRADRLKRGDYLCLKRGTQLKVKGVHNYPLEYARCLGYLVGDGYINRGQRYIGFNQVDKQVFDDFVRCAYVFLSDYSDKFVTRLRQPNSYGVYPYYEFVCNCVEARQYCASFGLFEGNSYDRVVPKAVFQGSREFMAAFLQGLFESDGSVSVPQGKDWSSHVSLCSVSKALLEDVCLILRSQFGIFSKIRLDDSHDDHSTFVLAIAGADNIYRFKKYIGFVSDKKRNATVVSRDALLGYSIAGTTNDCIPFSKDLKLSDYPRTRRPNFRRKVRAGVLTSKAAQAIYERDYYYCRVERVEDAGEAQVWDLTVPTTHSFVADGFVVHNTNAKLSKVGLSVMDPDYLAVTPMVPNYDDTTTEPVVLPAKLPFLILNGAEGIGVGITCSIPTFTVESVVDVLTRLLSGEKLKVTDLAKLLKPKQYYGGRLVNSESNKAQWLQLMKTGQASVEFEAPLEVDEAKKQITVGEWPNGLNPEKFVQKVRAMPETQRCYNSKGSTTFVIECKKAYNMVQFHDFVEKVRKLARAKSNYKFNCTHRVAKTEDGITTYQTQFLKLSVGQFIVQWLKLRIELEKRVINYRIAREQKAIDYSNLLLYASTKLDVIFKALRSSDAVAYMVRNMDVDETQAKAILELKVRQLSKLDQAEIKQKLAAQKKRMAELQANLKRPKNSVKKEMQSLLTLVKEDAILRDKKDNQKLIVK